MKVVNLRACVHSCLQVCMRAGVLACLRACLRLGRRAGRRAGVNDVCACMCTSVCMRGYALERVRVQVPKNASTSQFRHWLSRFKLSGVANAAAAGRPTVSQWTVVLDVELQQGTLMCCGSEIHDGMLVLAGQSPVHLHLNLNGVCCECVL